MTSKMSKEEFMAKVNKDIKTKGEDKMKTKNTKKVNLEKSVKEVDKLDLELLSMETEMDANLINIENNIEKLVNNIKKVEIIEESNIKNIIKEVKNLPIVDKAIKIELEKNEPKNDINEIDKAIKIINEQININQDLKIVETDNASGTSYFSGRTRLFKLVKSKRIISLEINVQLSKEFCKEITGMDDISKSTAHLKHMGTMKHHYRSTDSKEIARIISNIITEFKAINTKKEETKKAI